MHIYFFSSAEKKHFNKQLKTNKTNSSENQYIDLLNFLMHNINEEHIQKVQISHRNSPRRKQENFINYLRTQCMISF